MLPKALSLSRGYELEIHISFLVWYQNFVLSSHEWRNRTRDLIFQMVDASAGGQESVSLRCLSLGRESNPRSNPYQGFVLPLNYLGEREFINLFHNPRF